MTLLYLTHQSMYVYCSVICYDTYVYYSLTKLNTIFDYGLHVHVSVCFSFLIEFRSDGDELEFGGYSILNISRPMVTGNTIWYNDVLNCPGNEVCLAHCLPYTPTSAVDQCSNEVRVRCSK